MIEDLSKLTYDELVSLRAVLEGRLEKVNAEMDSRPDEEAEA